MIQWKKICCPVDFSEPSREAMRVAAELSQQHKAELVLLHIYQMPGVSFPEATVFAGQEALDELIKLIDRALAEWKEEAEERGADRVITHSAMGTPYAEIVRYAEKEHCDLLVMGTHGRTAIARALLGSVAEKVVRHAPCPVLTVRPQAAQQAAGFGAGEQR